MEKYEDQADGTQEKADVSFTEDKSGKQDFKDSVRGMDTLKNYEVSEKADAPDKAVPASVKAQLAALRADVDRLLSMMAGSHLWKP